MTYPVHARQRDMLWPYAAPIYRDAASRLWPEPVEVNMSAHAIQQILAVGKANIYHCIGPYGRRAGLDSPGSTSTAGGDHQASEIRKRLWQSSATHGVDILGFAVTANNVHVFVQVKPVLAATRPDQHGAGHCWRPFAEGRGKQAHPTDWTTLSTPADPFAPDISLLSRAAAPVGVHAMPVKPHHDNLTVARQ